MARRKTTYFQRNPGVPAPISVEVPARVRFSETDPMGIVWFGRYPAYFELGSEELGLKCGLSYRNFYEAGLRAPIVECHVDYHEPLGLGDEFIIRATLVWNEGSRIDTEYQLLNKRGAVATSGYTVQLIIDTAGRVCIASPPLLETCRRRWREGRIA